MQLFVGTLLDWTTPDGGPKAFRLLHLDPVNEMGFIIDIEEASALPVSRSLTEIYEGLANQKIRILTVDPYAHLHRPEDDIPARYAQRRDAAWNLIAEIVSAPDGKAFDPATRGQLVREAAQRHGSSKKEIYRHLKNYWKRGMTPNALIPEFHRCGGSGKEREWKGKKRGRPRIMTKLHGANPGINIGPEEAEKLRHGYRMYYEKRPEDGGRTKQQAYELTLQKEFRRGFELRQGVLSPVLLPDDKLPTYDQFVYWGPRHSDFKESQQRRHGKRDVALTKRAVLGDSTHLAYGPGSLYQIDTTPGDCWVVSALNRSRRIGRPNIITVVDTFSRLIVGLHVGLENASFFAAGLALENALADKVAFCHQFGIDIAPEEWPSIGLPEAVLADRGELEGHDASNLVQSLGIRVANTSPYRADLKPIVERTFRSLNESLIHHLPGAVRKPKERGELDPRLEAVLTLNEFRTLILHAVLQQNARWIQTYRLQPDMIADGVEPRPVDLWAWGITNRSGHLRTVDPAIVRANLLPGGKATVTYRGIKFRKLMFSCDRAMSEHWFEKARASKSRQIDVSFDPRLVDTIYLRQRGTSSLEACHLLKPDQRFAGMSWADVEDFDLSQHERKAHSKTNDLQSRADTESQFSHIVNTAKAEAAAANHGLNKSIRLSDVRTNRAEERRLDQSEALDKPQSTASQSGDNGDAEAPKPPEDQASESYVPPPSPLDLLKKNRESKWNDHE